MSKELIIINNLWGGRISEKKLKEAVAVTLDREWGEEKEVSLVFVPEKDIQKLNARYTGRDIPTDVLAFPVNGKLVSTRDFLGEIIICPDIALSHAREGGHSLEEELLLLAIHGTLHLLGYTDEEEEKRQIMIQKQREILKFLGEDESII